MNFYQHLSSPFSYLIGKPIIFQDRDTRSMQKIQTYASLDGVESSASVTCSRKMDHSTTPQSGVFKSSGTRDFGIMHAICGH